MEKRVLLINPPYPFEESPTPPFGLMSIGAYLIQEGFDVKIEDYIVNPYSLERLNSIISSYEPDVIGATGVTMNIKKAIQILKDCKEVNPEIPTLLGGPHASFDAENILKQNHEIDFVLRGEGEITFVEFLNAYGGEQSYRDILGLSFREDGKVIHNMQRPFIEDINILPYPARHLVELNKYRAFGFPINMLTSRGCPFECIFCVGSKMVGRRVRVFDVKRVVDEFEMLSKMGFKQINVVDDLFTSNKKRCTDICKEIIRRGIKHQWTAFARVDTVSKDLLEVMKESGCDMLCFGIESGNQGILDKIKKKTTLEKCRKAAELCHEVGIGPMTSYILGLPGETPETVKETMKFAKELSDNYGFHILAPFPGTEVREKSDEYGIKIFTDDWDKYDANQAVSESIYMPTGEVDRIVGEFYAGTEKHMLEKFTKYDNNEPLSDNDRELVKSFKEFEFIQEILFNELIDKFPEQETKEKDAVIDDFVNYLTEKTKFDRERISSHVDRLFNINCISINQENGKTGINWN